GLAVVPGGSAGAVQVVVVALSVLLASAAAGAFNQFIEAGSDRLMARTCGRPFASGALPCSRGWLVAIVSLLVLSVAAAAWLVNPLSATFVMLGALTYAVYYTAGLTRRTPCHLVIVGLTGTIAVHA